jgi:hypothetical protein
MFFVVVLFEDLLVSSNKFTIYKTLIMKTNYLLIIFLLLSTFGFAQSYDISCVVKEMGSGLPIPVMPWFLNQ